MNKILPRVAAVLLVAVGASACSSVPDWVDPTTWVGGSDNSTAAQFPADEDANAGPTVAEASDNGQYPDLANTPDRPSAPSTSQDRQQVASSLAADRSHANYSADALRGGTEAAAAPPPPPGSDEAVQQVDTGEQPAADSDSGSIDTTGGNRAAPVGQAPTQDAAPPAAAETAAPTQDVATAAAPAPSYPSGGAPAVPAVPAGAAAAGAQGVVLADAPLGFRPSAAPPLDPAVSQFVPGPIVSRYQQTAANAGVANSPITPASYSGTAVATNTQRHGRHSREGTDGIGGPEEMTGSVTANLASLDSPSVTTSAYANNSGATAIVYFPNDVAALGGSGRAQVEAAVQAWRAAGGQGYVRVVGHSSSRTANMPLEKHLQVIFKRSQDYANVVARALIRAGVPASKVLIEAVGDSQPVYYESMPQGEAGNRRAEIFVQG